MLTTLSSCSASLRHRWPPRDVSVRCPNGATSATRLITLDCGNNGKLNSIAFCKGSLEELSSWGDGCVSDKEISNAPLNLQIVRREGTTTTEHLSSFVRVGKVPEDLPFRYVRAQQ